MNLWLKADDPAGLGLTGTNVDTWTDTGRSLTFSDLPINPTPAKAQFISGSTDFNFNPSLDFTSSAVRLSLTSNAVLDADDDTLSFYAVTHGVDGAPVQSIFNYRSGTDGAGLSGLEINGKVFAGTR